MSLARSLEAVFNPATVAVVGASATPGSPGWVLWRNLEEFPGERIPVSRSASDIGGAIAYATLRDAPGPIDLAVVAVAASVVPEVIRDAVAAGVRACVIVSAGFAESGPDGAALQAEVLATGRQGGVLIVGPNSLGVQNCDLSLNASLSSGTALGGGGISVITQSGSYAMAAHALSEDDGLRFAVAYSSGNRCDIDDAEVVDHLRADDHTRVICMFAESLADGERFLGVARRTTPAKPLVVAAVGRSDAGARSAASHTAALARDRRAWDDVMSAVGVSVARSGLEMLDAAKTMALQPIPRGSRVAIITNSGGTGTELSDLLAAEELDVPQLSANLRQRLDALMPGYASSANPIDVTPAWARFADMYPAVLDEVARSGEVDIVMPVLLHRSAESPDVALAIVEAVRNLRADGVEIPIYVCWVARRSAWSVAKVLQDAGIPCLEWPERTARAAGHAVRYGQFLRERGSNETPLTLQQSSRVGDEPQSRELTELLARFGIPLIPTQVCTTVEQAVEVAESVGFPVVAKVAHATLSHKTDVGGVRMSLRSADEVAVAATHLLGLAAAARVAIQPQVSGLEVVVGGLRDNTFGPVVAFGLGGIFVEVIAEVRFAPAPLGEREALALIKRSRAAALLTGYRGLPAADLWEVARLLCAVGDLVVQRPDLSEIDLNPVIIGRHGVLAVDARAVWAP